MNYIQPRLAFISTCLGLMLSACASVPGSAASDAQVAADVRAVMEAQQTAWNRGDIDGFMNGYDRGETTTFVSGDQLIRGWQTVLERYKKQYSSREQMGTLTFSELSVISMGPDRAVADGRWQLTRANDAPHGRFTLIFHRGEGGWRIVHDTTTAAGQ